MPKLRSTLALIVAIAALAAIPAVAAAQQDLRSPDARDAALTQDLRSPDARDAAAGRLPGGSDVVVVSAPGPVATSPGGFDWRAAAIGAGVAIGLVLIGTSAVLLLRRRRPIQVA
jgi:hypothetical protein